MIIFFQLFLYCFYYIHTIHYIYSYIYDWIRCAAVGRLDMCFSVESDVSAIIMYCLALANHRTAKIARAQRNWLEVISDPIE